jgi:uncharacterized membrane protein YfcA
MIDVSPGAFGVAVVFLLAGFVKGVIGVGLPTIGVGLLTLVMSPARAAALLVVPNIVTNIWQMFGPGFAPLVRRLATMLIGICVGTWAGAGMLSGDGNGRAAIALGIALALYAVSGLVSLRIAVPQRVEPWLSPLIGVATGLITAATGIFVIPAVPYLQALGLEKDELVQALGISFLVSTLALGASLASTGVLSSSVAIESLLALVPTLAGMGLGQVVRARISARLFRRCFFLGLLLLGLHLALRTLL